MWLLLIRPQQRRVRQHQATVSSLRVGDEIVTAGGLCATVTALDEEKATVMIAPGVEVQILRGAVSQREDPPGAEIEKIEEADSPPELGTDTGETT